MDAQHALKGRQKLEDLRRKKAAALSGNGAQGELEAMTIRVQNLEEKLQQVEAERDLLRKQKEEASMRVESLQDDLDRARGQVSQDEKTVTMLRKSLDTITMERDAAFISREDMVAQLRLTKRRLQEAEEVHSFLNVAKFLTVNVMASLLPRLRFFLHPVALTTPILCLTKVMLSSNNLPERVCNSLKHVTCLGAAHSMIRYFSRCNQRF